MTSAQRRRILVDALKLFDLSVMVVAFALATVPSWGVGRTISAADFFSMRVKLGNLIIFLGLLLLWHLFFSGFGLYGSHRLSSRLSESFDIVRATALSAAVVLVAASLFNIRMVSLRYVGVFFAFCTVLLVASRLILRFILVQTRLHGRNLRHVLIVGTSKRAIEFADRLEANSELGPDRRAPTAAPPSRPRRRGDAAHTAPGSAPPAGTRRP